MVSSYRKLLLVILVAVALSGCELIFGVRDPQDYTPTDPNQPIQVRQGERFTIVLRENPTTGYEWKIEDAPDPADIEVVGREYVASQPVTTGSGGVVIWQFRAIDTGRFTITFGNYPPSGDEAESFQAFQIVVE